MLNANHRKTRQVLAIVRFCLILAALAAGNPAFAQVMSDEDLLARFGHAEDAQVMSDDEMLARFRAQKQAFVSATEGDGELSRGLTLVAPDAGAASPVSGTEEVAVAPVRSEPIVAANANAETAVVTPAAVTARFDPSMSVDLRIEFEFDSASISPSQAPVLAQICRVMQASDVHLLRIIGHTDAAGPDAYNERLSGLRAREVGRHLINDCGIAPSRLEMVGYGERFPLDAGHPGAAENRRVEFQALG